MLCNEFISKQLKTSMGRMSVISRKEFEDMLTQKAFPLSRPRQEDSGLNHGVVCCGRVKPFWNTYGVAKVRRPESGQPSQQGDMYQILFVWLRWTHLYTCARIFCELKKLCLWRVLQKRSNFGGCKRCLACFAWQARYFVTCSHVW